MKALPLSCGIITTVQDNLTMSDHLKWAPAKTVSAADRLIELKNKKSPWEVIQEVVKLWMETNPTEYDSFVYTLDKTKRTRKITKAGGSHFSGLTYDRESGGHLQYKLDIPVKVVYLIRKLYPDMPMDKAFYKKWGKVFPKMVVMEKV